MSEPERAKPEVTDTDRLLRRLRSLRVVARSALLFERVWPAIWPPLGIAGVFICLALLGLFSVIPPWVHLVLLAVTVAAFVTLLALGLRRVAAPDDEAADRRLEQASGLSHRPLAVLNDRPARPPASDAPDPAQDVLWEAHVARVVGQVRRLRVGLPRPGLARLDRRALRGGLLVALVAALVIAWSDAPARLAEAFSPTLPVEPGAPPLQLQVWITPPAYTGQAPRFLNHDPALVTVPVGSHVTASVTGGEGEPPALRMNSTSEPFRVLGPGSFQGELDLQSGGKLAVSRSGSELGAWDIAVRANQAPQIAWADAPGPVARGLQVRLPWQATDEYGVVQLQAELRLVARPDAPPIVVNIPVPGGTTKSAKGTSQQDLTAHPWAGLPVTARLVGRDVAGLSGASDDAALTLPERSFRNPVARALMVVRRGLSLDPEDRATAVGRLDQLLMAEEVLKDDAGAYLNLADIYYRLVRDRAPEAVGEAQALMWRLALHLEEGGTERTARALEAARQAVRDALDRVTREPTDQNRAELERKLSDLENAIREHMAALMEQARRENAQMPLDPDAQRLDAQEMERKAEEAREAAREGKVDDAKQRLAELEQMLDQLQNARPEHGQASAKNAERRQRGRQQMGALQDMIGRQGNLLDHSQQRSGQEARGSHPQRQPGQKTPDANGKTANGQENSREADDRVQQALRRALGELMQQFGDLTGKVPQSLSDADQAMQDAGQALGQGQDDQAGDAEQRAIEALQKGGHEMSQQMVKQFGPGQGGEDGDDGDPSSGSQLGLQNDPGGRDGTAQGMNQGQHDRGEKRDPLGRQVGQGTSGSDESDTVHVPEEMERQRTRQIQDELRRRGADRGRPQPELDYIDRLLKQF